MFKKSVKKREQKRLLKNQGTKVKICKNENDKMTKNVKINSPLKNSFLLFSKNSG